MADRNLELALRLRADMNQALGEFDKAIGKTNKQAAASKKAGKAAKDSAKGVDKASQAAERNARATGRAAKQNDLMAKGMRRLGAAAAAYFTLQTAKRIIADADAYKLLQARLKNATEATGDYAAVSESVYDISQKNGVALATTVGLFQSLARTAPELGVTNDEILKLTNAVQQIGSISGASTANMTAGLTQFSQAMAGGVLRAEEMNSILENIPELANRIAKGMGLTTGQLRLAVVDGKVLSKDVFAAIMSQLDEINAQAERMPDTLGKATERAANSFQRMVSAADKTVGLTDAIAYFVTRVSRGMDRATKSMEEGTDDTNERLEAEKALNELFDKRLSVVQKIAGLEASGLTGRMQGALQVARRELAGIDEEMANLSKRRDEILAKSADDATPSAAAGKDPAVVTLRSGNAELKGLVKQRNTLAKELAEINKQFGGGAADPSQRSASANVLDLSRQQSSIQQLLDEGNVQGAVDQIERAKLLVESLAGQKGISDSYLAKQTQGLIDLAEKAQDIEIDTAPPDEQKVRADAEAHLQIYRDAFNVQNPDSQIEVPVKVNKDGVIEDVRSVGELAQAQLDGKPLIWWVKMVPDTSELNAAAGGQPVNISIGNHTIETMSRGPVSQDALRSLKKESLKTDGGG